MARHPGDLGADGQQHLNQALARNLWQLGYLDPNDIFISVNQGDERPEDFVADITRDGVVDGRSAVGDNSWIRYVSPDSAPDRSSGPRRR